MSNKKNNNNANKNNKKISDYWPTKYHQAREKEVNAAIEQSSRNNNNNNNTNTNESKKRKLDAIQPSNDTEWNRDTKRRSNVENQKQQLETYQEQQQHKYSSNQTSSSSSASSWQQSISRTNSNKSFTPKPPPTTTFSGINNNNTNTTVTNSNDKWDSAHVKLPASAMNTYKARMQNNVKSKWYLIQSLLKTQIRTTYELQEIIAKMKCNDNANSMDMGMFVDFFQSYIDKDECDKFFNETLPYMQNIALKLPELFPTPIKLLRKQKEDVITLTAEQIACLMSHAFFCTFPRRDKTFNQSHEYYTFPNVNFSELYRETHSVTTEKMLAEKLKTIIHYFSVIAKDPDTTRIVEYRRRVLHSCDATNDSQTIFDISSDTQENLVGMWKSCDFKICPCDIRLQGSLEDEPDTSHVDFANKMIGGGVIGKGCVQEEIRFLINTECIISRLFTEEFDDNECLIIRGSKRFANYSGYSDTFQFEGPYDGPVFHEEIVCIDALNFMDRSMFRNTTDQYKPQWIVRELNKAYCAFQKLSYDPFNHDMSIATGHWGGGAFSGDRELKAIVQLMAATVAQRKGMIYFAYGDENFRNNFDPMYSLLQNLGATVSELFSALMEYRAKRIQHRTKQVETGSKVPPPSILTHICDWFAGEEGNFSVDDDIDIKPDEITEGDQDMNETTFIEEEDEAANYYENYENVNNEDNNDSNENGIIRIE
jgi:hypothetical protein